MAKNFFKDNWLSITAIFLLTAVLLGAGFYFGYSKGQLVPKTITPTQTGEAVDGDFNVFWDAWRKLKTHHVGSASTTDQDLIYGAMSGLAGSFDDPHTVFLPPKEATKFIEDVSGSFGGIGAEIGTTDGIISVVTPLKNSPADRAGIQPGDLILKVDDKTTETMTINDAVGYIRGKIGTQVTLTMLRKDWLQPREIILTRERIVVPTLDLEILEDGAIAHLSLYSFNENAPQLFTEAAADIIRKGAKGLILDMRNNPGGYLEVAQNLAGWFLRDGEIVVTERFSDGHEDPFVAEGTGAFKNFPVVVLINKGSASAAEILAGALRDNNGVQIVGQKSYGKGTVQELFPLKDGSNLKITIAHWVMPKGFILDKNGIEPDVTVENTDEDIKAEKDPQLEKAIEVLKAQIDLNKTQAVR